MSYSTDQNFASHDFGPFDGRVWLNAAHQGPLPKVAAEAGRLAIAEKVAPHRIRDESFHALPAELRSLLGRLIEARGHDIVLGNSTTFGLDLLANSFPWKQGDEILLIDGDFPADIFPWIHLRSRGVTVRLIKPLANAITGAELVQQFRPGTRLFCTSWVNSFNGHTIDLKTISEACSNAGVHFVLNASQALGARRLRIGDFAISALTCCGYKWLCGPYGTGFCWIAPSLRERLEANHGYWLAMQQGRGLDHMLDYSVPDDVSARAFDVFCPANFMNFMPWSAAIEYLLAKDLAQIEAHDQALVSRLVDRLLQAEYELVSPVAGPSRSTLVVTRPGANQPAKVVQRKLTAAGFDVALREGNLRFSPHLYNTVNEIDAAVDCALSE